MDAQELKADLVCKLKELASLNRHPALFLSDYFYSIRNEIDYETERVLFELDETKEDVTDYTLYINQLREVMIDELNAQEKACMKAIRADMVSSDALVEWTLIDEIQADVETLLETDDGQDARRFEDIYVTIAKTIDRARNDLKRKILLNQTFVFQKCNKNGLGVLAHFEDIYLNEFEHACLKRSALHFKPLSSYIIETFEALEELQNENKLVKSNQPRSLSKNLFILWKFGDFIENSLDRQFEMANNSAGDEARKIIADSAIVRVNTTNLVDDEESAYLFDETSIDLSQCSIERIETDSFKYVPFIRKLYLSHNLLKSIDAHTFKGLVNLRELYLSNNQIETISAGAFDDLKNLNDLYLDRNRLVSVDSALFSHLRNLQILDLWENNLSTIDADAFRNLTELQELYLNGNKLLTIDSKAFSHLFSLKVFVCQ